MKNKREEIVERPAPKGKEAQDRANDKPNAPPPKELGGREGPEPTRYGDWEVKGIATDF